jgi:large subunit ribosomal protein L25
MKEISINGTLRTETGKKASKLLRQAGNVPCNLYGEKRGEDGLPVALSFVVSEKEINKVIFTPHVYLVKITIDGTEHTAIIKETQFHPVKDNVLHVDFYEVNPNKPIVIGVPIQTEGLAAGVRAGGRLTTMLRKLNVRGLYTNIPEKLVIDVTPLELGKSMKVGELSFDNIELVTPKEVVVCTIKMTRAARSAADAQQNA